MAKFTSETAKKAGEKSKRTGKYNKTTEEIRQKFSDFVNDNLDDIQIQYTKLKSPKDKLYFMIHIGEFVLPKLRSMEVKAEIDMNVVTTTYVLDDHTTVEI